MRKISQKRFDQLWDEVEAALEAVTPRNYHDGMKKMVQRIEQGKTPLELFYCGIITEHILNHAMEEEGEEEEIEPVKKRYIN